MTTKEEIQRIESRSDLKFPNSIKETSEDSTTEKKDDSKDSGKLTIKKAIVGGAISGLAFFGVTKVTNFMSSKVEEFDAGEDDEDQEESIDEEE